MSELAQIETMNPLLPVFDPTPRYDLTQDELAGLETSLVDAVREQVPQEGIVTAVIEPGHPYANILRAYESAFFPEVAELDAEVEENTLFLAMVDMREGTNRVVHGATITGFRTAESQPTGEGTGFVVIDDLIEMGNFTAEEFQDYYAAKGINLASCNALETNFRVGERVPSLNGISVVQLAYSAILRQLTRNQPAPVIGESGWLASINRASRISFARVGIESELLMGRDDFVTSESLRGLKFDPVFIPYTQGVIDTFGPLATPQVIFESHA